MKRCKIDGCNDVVHGKGLCDFHCTRLRKYGDPLGGGSRRLPPNSLGKCSVKNCNNKAVSSHLCANHRAKKIRYGDPIGGSVQDGRSFKWRTNKLGYIERWAPGSEYAAKNGFVFQHRQVMGEAIGRPLLKTESVHHKNGDRSDNRIGNLELWSKRQPAGQRVQDKVKWAREILKEYGSLFK